MATGERNDPYRAFNFRIEVDGVPAGAFSECSGLSAEGESVDYREGTDFSLSVRKLTGLRSYSNITLKRGYTQDNALWQWYRNVLRGIQDRRDVTIVLHNEEQKPVLRWTAENAWVNKIEGPSFNAANNEVAMESVEIVHEGLMLDM